MAHFAELDENNKVIRAIVVSNAEITNEKGEEVEQLGIDFCKSLYGENTVWIQCSYNASFRKKMANPGDTYLPERDAFVSPKPDYELPEGWEFVLNEETMEWEEKQKP